METIVDFSFIHNSFISHCAMLFFGTFLQEDLAVFTGGMFIIKKDLPYLFVFLSLYSGIIVSDLLIYGLGVAARSLPWTQKYLLNSKVQYAKNRLEKNIIPSIALCRLLPGLLFPTFIACGWLGISFFQFTLITIIAAAFYAAILLFIVTTIGATLIHQIGAIGWVVIFGIAILIVLYKTFKSVIPKTNRNNAEGELPTSSLSLTGMPTFTWKASKVSLSEKIPPLLFYFPVGVQWLLLSIYHRSFTLPTAANPFIEAGGLWGESKSDLLNQISKDFEHYVATFVTLNRSSVNSNDDFKSALEKMQTAGISFPLVAKPDIGWQGYGVRLLETEKELQEYIASYPLSQSLIIQKYVPFSGEAGVFYIRIPGEERGYLSSLTFRYFPYIVGDGTSTVEELIAKDERTRHKAKFYSGSDNRHAGISPELFSTIPKIGEKIRLAFIGSLRVGGTYRDGTQFITPALTERFDKLVRSMPSFHFGRFDIRFESTEKLQMGEGFSIIEVNGAGSEAIHIWDIDKSIFDVYKELFSYQSLLFKIAAMNRKNGYHEMGLIEFIKYSRKYNNLVHSYPRSE